jgi:hypothetical protein
MNDRTQGASVEEAFAQAGAVRMDNQRAAEEGDYRAERPVAQSRLKL